MKHSRRSRSRRVAWIGGVLAIAAAMPGRGWTQEGAPAALISLPRVALEEQGAPLAFDCTEPSADARIAPWDPEPLLPVPPVACAGAPLGFSSAGSRFGWFGALGKFRYLVALPALLALGSGGGSDSSGAPGELSSEAEGDVPERRVPYRDPVPEPTSTALFVTGTLLVAGALRTAKATRRAAAGPSRERPGARPDPR